jgi:hypothetical protein
MTHAWFLLDLTGTGSCGAQRISILQRLYEFLSASRYDEFRDGLARAESEGELPEFYALSFHALLAMSERSELASDYLEMAEAVASSPYEKVIVAENRITYEVMQDSPRAAAERCRATLAHLQHNEHLWKDLLSALCRLGNMESIEATLRGLTEQDYSALRARSASPPRCYEYS